MTAKLHGCGLVGCYSADSIFHGGPPFDPSGQRIDGGKWVYFRLISDSYKTFVWAVYAKERDVWLGNIRWLGRWRAYTFYPTGETIFAASASCLRDIAAFIEARMQYRK